MPIGRTQDMGRAASAGSAHYQALSDCGFVAEPLLQGRGQTVVKD